MKKKGITDIITLERNYSGIAMTKQKLYGFWKYDCVPFVLGDEIKTIHPNY